jgi:hypothetical protein
MQQETTSRSRRRSLSRFDGLRLLTLGAVLICATAATGVVSLVALCVHEIIRSPVLYQVVLARPPS